MYLFIAKQLSIKHKNSQEIQAFETPENHGWKTRKPVISQISKKEANIKLKNVSIIFDQLFSSLYGELQYHSHGVAIIHLET